METSDYITRLTQINKDLQDDKPAAREEMLRVAQALVTSLQTPSEYVSYVGWAEPARLACIKTAYDMKIFETLLQYEESGGARPTEIVQATGGEERLLYGSARIMKHLVAMNVLAEPSAGVFTNTRLSKQLTNSEYRDGILHAYDVAGPCFRQLPVFLKEHRHREPTNQWTSPFQMAHKTPLNLFEWLHRNKSWSAAFANYMKGWRGSKAHWFDPALYPVQSQLVDGFSIDTPFLVDVGGGKGTDLVALDRAFPSLPGTLVLQDLPEVVSSIDTSLLPSNVTVMAHDFFDPQPTIGARAYFLHSVLYGWDDERCVWILQRLKEAMTPGYSKVLVHELIVPSRGASWGVTSFDMLMMALSSKKERTEGDFRRLFEEAGLEIEKIWVYEPDTEVVIEAYRPA